MGLFSTDLHSTMCNYTNIQKTTIYLATVSCSVLDTSLLRKMCSTIDSTLETDQKLSPKMLTKENKPLINNTPEILMTVCILIFSPNYTDITIRDHFDYDLFMKSMFIDSVNNRQK